MSLWVVWRWQTSVVSNLMLTSDVEHCLATTIEIVRELFS